VTEKEKQELIESLVAFAVSADEAESAWVKEEEESVLKEIRSGEFLKGTKMC
jgi:hypothetical protein